MSDKIPNHIGIIIDGNRRWAKQRNLPSLEGHKKGYENVGTISRHAFKRGVKILSIYAFSTENWKRSKEEVSYLMDLLRLMFSKEADKLVKENVRLKVSGSRDKLDQDLLKLIDESQAKTKNGTKATLNICFNYGGHQEIVDAVKKIINNGINAEAVTEDLINSYLYMADIPNPDFIIRTSGEQRLSGFMTWQSVYSEFYFPSKHWPEFSTDDFDLALEEFNQRQRRFGGN